MLRLCLLLSRPNSTLRLLESYMNSSLFNPFDLFPRVIFVVFLHLVLFIVIVVIVVIFLVSLIIPFFFLIILIVF